MKHEIMNFIPRGQRNAIRMKDLAKLTGWKMREVRQAIFAARCDGELICSSCDKITGGYFQPVTVAEVKEYKLMQESRIRSAAKAVRSARQFLRQKEIGE